MEQKNLDEPQTVEQIQEKTYENFFKNTIPDALISTTEKKVKMKRRKKQHLGGKGNKVERKTEKNAGVGTHRFGFPTKNY